MLKVRKKSYFQENKTSKLMYCTKTAITTRNIKWYESSRKHEETALKMLKVRKKSYFQENKTSKLMYCTKTIEHFIK